MKSIKRYLFSTLAIVLLPLNLYAQAVLTNGLIAFYPFNGNANDESGNTNNGVALGATLIADRFGNPSSAYQFAGTPSSKITIGSTNLLLPIPFSVSLWINYSGGTQNPRVISVAANYSGYEITTSGTGSSRRIVFDNGTTSGAYGVFSSDTFRAGVWHQAIGVCTSNALMIYIDGQFEGTTPLTGAQVYPSDLSAYWPSALGGPSLISSPNDCFAGAIDEVRLYNVALSSNEVAELYAIEYGPHVNLIQAVKPWVSGLTLGMNYQLQASSNLINWTNIGAVFAATNTFQTFTQYYDVENWNQLFFRVQVSP